MQVCTYKCSTRPKWAVEWLGGSFLGQDNISLIRKLAASSDPEDPGCSRTHAAPLAAARADTLSQPVNGLWGLRSQQVEPNRSRGQRGPPGRRKGGHRPQSLVF